MIEAHFFYGPQDGRVEDLDRPRPELMFPRPPQRRYMVDTDDMAMPSTEVYVYRLRAVRHNVARYEFVR